jgi:hypothetical protein
MFRSVVALQCPRHGVLTTLHARVAEFGKLDRIAFTRQDRIQNALPTQPSDFVQDVVKLQIHLVERFLPVHHMLKSPGRKTRVSYTEARNPQVTSFDQSSAGLPSQMPIVEGKGCQFGFLHCWVDAFSPQDAENCKRPLKRHYRNVWSAAELQAKSKMTIGSAQMYSAFCGI